MRDTDPILAPSRGSASDATGALGRPDETDREFVIALYDWGRVAGVDASVAVVQAFHETADLTSVRWFDDRNPAGIGIPAGDTPQPFGIPDGDAAARLHIQCLYALVCRQLHLEIPLWPDADRWVREVWLGRHILDPGFPGVQTVGDLNRRYRDRTGDLQATWAWDDRYSAKLISKSSRVFPALPNVRPIRGTSTQARNQKQPAKETTMALTFGNVPHPDYEDLPIVKAEGHGQDNLGQRSVKGVVWHRILGSLRGTNEYFRDDNVNALTDYGVGVLATDGASLDGVIYRWNDPLGEQSGWASGTYNGAYGDGLAFAQKYGVDAINRDQASIEISGDYSTALSEQSRDAIAGLTAYWADQYRIPWDVFPVAPQDGFSFVRWHQEFTLGTGKVCPGEVVIAETPALIERTRAIMKQYQTGSAEVTVAETDEGYPAPITYPWLTDPAELAKAIDRTIGTTRVFAFRRVWTAKRDTPRFRNSSGTEVIGPPIDAGMSFVGEFVYRANNEWWVLTAHGTRVRMADLDLQVALQAA
jgi:hypothetical protein